MFIARLIILSKEATNIDHFTSHHSFSYAKSFLFAITLKAVIFLAYDIIPQHHNYKMSKLTKYLLMMPLAYMGYCAYQD